MISVLIPTYKNRGGLTRCVDSALAQMCDDDIEIIVVDDNNPDSLARAKTEELMHKYDGDSNVIYIKHPQNKNGAAARNTGIKASKGEYIAFLDDDDLFLPGKLQKQMAFLQIHPEYDAVYCLAQKNGKNYSSSCYEGRPVKEMLMMETCMYTPSLMFRREALLSINGFDEALRRHQDYDLLLRFFASGHNIGCVKETLTEIGLNEGENILSGEKLETLKAYFFSKFGSYIDDIDNQEPGFKNAVYAKHYAGVFLQHVKHKDIKLALSCFGKYFFKSPKVFTSVINNSVKSHLS